LGRAGTPLPVMANQNVAKGRESVMFCLLAKKKKIALKHMTISLDFHWIFNMPSE
jgi:hypothetical protein